MKKSIFLKIFAGHLTIIAVLGMFVLLFSFRAIKTDYVDFSATSLKNLAAVVADHMGQAISTKNRETIERYVKRMGRTTGTRITVVAPDGTVLADSDEDARTMENHRTRTEIAQALEGETGQLLRFSETLKENMLYVAVPVSVDGRIVGVVRVSRFLKDINILIEGLWADIFKAVLIILAVALLLSLWFSRGLSNPIRELSLASQKVAREDFNVRVFLKQNNELKELADNFNFMVGRIKTLVAGLSLQREELDTIISSLQEGLLLLSSDEKVLYSNESLQRITSSPATKGRFFWEVMREPAFNDLIRHVRETRENHIREIVINERVYLCSATFLASHEEIAIIFHDITEMKRLERIKTDFVLNVSHELRTPLTSIKGFVETLEEGITSQVNRHYLSIIGRNTDRMISIITDLLLLSELEDRVAAMELSDVDLKSTIENALKIFETTLREKGLTAEVAIDSEASHLQGDLFKLEQMFINLIHNAIKYTDHGGLSISTAPLPGNILQITIADTGIGIPREEIPRIFERFYVVDKSRSKKLGGTGLGLSIVKHVVLLHSGTIEVQSSPGNGTRFIVTLPINPR